MPELDASVVETAQTDAAESDVGPGKSETTETERPGAEIEAAEATQVEQVDSTEIVDAEQEAATPPPESLGGDGDDAAEERERRQRQRFLRNYKI